MQDRKDKKNPPIENPEDPLPAGDQYDPNSPASDNEEIEDPNSNKKIEDPRPNPNKVKLPPDPDDKPEKKRR